MTQEEAQLIFKLRCIGVLKDIVDYIEQAKPHLITGMGRSLPAHGNPMIGSELCEEAATVLGMSLREFEDTTATIWGQIVSSSPPRAE